MLGRRGARRSGSGRSPLEEEEICMSRYTRRRSMRGFTLSLAVMVIAVMGLVAASAASAAPVVGPSEIDFYSAPSPIPAGSTGTLIQYRTTTVNFGPATPSVNAWDVMYQSTDQQGNPDVVTGTVLTPTAAYKGGT